MSFRAVSFLAEAFQVSPRVMSFPGGFFMPKITQRFRGRGKEEGGDEGKSLQHTVSELIYSLSS
jgi:hypothetical protein